MVDWNLLKERLRGYRRRSANTWALFKESRIGVAGIGIILIFVVLGAFAPILGLRDPIQWRAPSEDVIALQTFWQADTSTFLFGAGSPIVSQVAFRIIPAAIDARSDRLYAASGDKLLAINPVTGTRGWNQPFTTAGEITAGPVAVNFGSKRNPGYLDEVVFAGTAGGTLYALNDSASAPSGETGTPGGSDLVRMTLVGRIVSIAVWSEPQDDPPAPAEPGRHPGEAVYVGTDAGHLYAFDAATYRLLWERDDFGAGVPVLMADGPLNSPTSPSYSPALTEDGRRLFVNAGAWFGLYAQNGTLAWPGFFSVSTPWSSPPVVALPSTLADGRFEELVYAAADDGWLFAREAGNGRPYAFWETSTASQLHPSGLRTIPVMQTAAQRDPGPLHAPYIDSTTIYVTSESGYMYAITRDQVGTLPAGSAKWQFTEMILHGRGFHFTAAASLSVSHRIIFGVGVDPMGTPDPSDDEGILYSLNEVGGLIWRRDFNGSLSAPPSVWTTTTGAQFVPGSSVWVGTGRGWVYSISSTGRYLAPLPPGTYPSGNQYLWGTDNQGRDILSQFIWGSRIALLVGFAASLLTVGIGLIVGLVAGYLGEKTDVVLMRFTDVVLVLPTLPLLIILSAVLGASIWNIILVIALIGWPGTARVIRSEILSLKERPYIQSARVTGASSVRIMFRHLTPNVMPLVFLYMTFAVSGAILFEAALSFLGLGDINTPSWGTMLSTVQQSDLLRAYWWLLPPGLGITLFSLAFYFVGRAFEQIINPRLRVR